MPGTDIPPDTLAQAAAYDYEEAKASVSSRTQFQLCPAVSCCALPSFQLPPPPTPTPCRPAGTPRRPSGPRPRRRARRSAACAPQVPARSRGAVAWLAVWGANPNFLPSFCCLHVSGCCHEEECGPPCHVKLPMHAPSMCRRNAGRHRGCGGRPRGRGKGARRPDCRRPGVSRGEWGSACCYCGWSCTWDGVYCACLSAEPSKHPSMSPTHTAGLPQRALPPTWAASWRLAQRRPRLGPLRRRAPPARRHRRLRCVRGYHSPSFFLV